MSKHYTRNEIVLGRKGNKGIRGCIPDQPIINNFNRIRKSPNVNVNDLIKIMLCRLGRAGQVDE